MNSLLRLVTLILAFFVCSVSVAEQEPEGEKEKPVSYYKQIRPLFQAKCQGCHQPAKPLGEYVMTSFEKLLSGGETGDAAIVPGKPDESYLLEQITPAVAGEPPDTASHFPSGENRTLSIRSETPISRAISESSSLPASARCSNTSLNPETASNFPSGE